MKRPNLSAEKVTELSGKFSDASAGFNNLEVIDAMAFFLSHRTALTPEFDGLLLDEFCTLYFSYRSANSAPAGASIQ